MLISAARSIFRPSSASAGGVCGRSPPNAALAAAYRHMSEAVPIRPSFPVDTLGIARGMQARGIESHHAEAITAAITEVTNDVLESVGKAFVSQDQLQKSEKTRDADFCEFKSTVKISQEQHISSMQRSRDTLEAKIDGLHLLIKDELMKQLSEFKDQNTKQLSEFKDQNTKQLFEFKDEYTKITSKLDNQIQAMKSEVAVAKFEVITYCVGSLVTISTLAIAVLRYLM